MSKEKLEILKLKGDIFRGKLKSLFTIILLVSEVVLIAFLAMKYTGHKFGFLDPTTQKVAIVKIDEEITSKTAQDVYNSIESIKKEKNYKAIIMQISSPGGSPTASAEIAEYLKDINKTIPITMYVDGMAASGAYYIASAIKPIIANKNAIIGSIGVIMPQYDASELAKKIGIKENTLTAGKFKQPFSLLKQMSDESKEYIESNLLKPTYENFLDDVANNRGIAKDKIREFAEGKIFIANTKEIQGILIDKISNLFKVKQSLKEKYGKDIEFEVINKEFDPKGLFGVLSKEIVHEIKNELKLKLN
jgi:protease-4